MFRRLDLHVNKKEVKIVYLGNTWQDIVWAGVLYVLLTTMLNHHLKVHTYTKNIYTEEPLIMATLVTAILSLVKRLLSSFRLFTL